MLYFNVLGIIIALVSGVIGIIFGEIMGTERGAIIVAGVLMGVIDLFYRSTRKGPLEGLPLFSRTKGGNIMFLPVWLWGTALFILGILY